jgi:hypothetical protein
MTTAELNSSLILATPELILAAASMVLADDRRLLGQARQHAP